MSHALLEPHFDVLYNFDLHFWTDKTSEIALHIWPSENLEKH